MGWGQGVAIHGGLRPVGVLGYGVWGEGAGFYRPTHTQAGERGGDSIDPAPAPLSIDTPPPTTGGDGGHSPTQYSGL